MSDATSGSTTKRGPHLERVLVAVDFSEPSIRAAEWIARHFARGAELVLMHAIHVPPPPRFFEGRYAPAEPLIETARAGAELRLREIGSSIATGLVWTEVRVGRPDDEILRVAADYRADVIVIGRPATRQGLWGRLGTTAQRVVRRSSVPVLLAAEVPPGPPTRLLVGLDDSDLTDPVLDWTRLLVRRSPAEAVVMHVVHPLKFDHTSTLTHGLMRSAADALDTDAHSEDPPLREARHWLAERIGNEGMPSANGSMIPVAIEGLPVEVLIGEVERRGADFIVVGSRGAGAAERLLLGSVAEGVLRDSRCPVLVVVRPD